MRASDADRDRVLAEVGEHFQAGRLTTDELQERTGQALAAKTMGDLSGLLSDLPALHPAPLPAPAPQAAARARRSPVPVISALAIVVIVAANAVAATTDTRSSAWAGALSSRS
jgi:hypothetical protein